MQPPFTDTAFPSRVLREKEAAAQARAGSILTIDLDAVRANYRVLKGLAAPADCAAVVKADAYGLGAAAVIPVLLGEGCRTFFVAHWDEALRIRALLPPEAGLFVLNGLPPGTEREAAGTAGIVPVLNSLQQARDWMEAAGNGAPAPPAALHVDTGLSRLGIPAGELDALHALGHRRLDLRLVLSHLACGEETASPTNAVQLSAFRRAITRFPGIPASLANSSGIFLGADYHFDCVRAGAALYGINPLFDRANPMRQAVRLQGRVMQTCDLPAGSGIGYGHDFITAHAMRTATVGLGYADGWPRRARTSAFVAGKALPILGRVSMDSIVLDISGLGREECVPGTMLDFLCAEQTPDDLARLSGTIGYEILTGLGSRPYRIHSAGN